VDAAADAAQAFEMVFIPERDRGTWCISSQVGCALDCSFCSTGQQGFNRNLSVAEIVGQVWLARRELERDIPPQARPAYSKSTEHRLITNVVFMGMGRAAGQLSQRRARDAGPARRLGFDFSRRRVTLSTSGLAPQILRLAEECSVALAVSLHAPTTRCATSWCRSTASTPIRELLEACWIYLDRQTAAASPSST